MSSRRLEDLTPEVHEAAQAHRARCADAGIDLLIYCTFRDVDEQARLFRQGRSPEQIQRRVDRLRTRGFPGLAQVLAQVATPNGSRVTFAGPGESFHQYRLAYDCVPLVDGKPVWSTSGEAADLWQRVGELGQESGLEWAGTWSRFREFPHFQITGGRNVRDLMEERFGGAADAAEAAAMAVLVNDEGTDLRQALAEANTVFLVFASQTGPTDDDLRTTFDLAQRVTNFSPALWRTSWVRRPDQLDDDLRGLLWPNDDLAPAVLLGLGTGLDRNRVRTYQLAELGDALAVASAFAQG